jgi:uncharacterized membrane protein
MPPKAPKSSKEQAKVQVSFSNLKHIDDGDRRFLLKYISRYLLLALFVLGGIMHIVSPRMFIAIVPPFLPWPAALVAISGVAEIAGGLGLLSVRTRRAAGLGLIVLLLAVFPANIYMAWKGMMLPAWILWARLPLQFLLIWWVNVATRKSEYSGTE